jgi:hypothetical protein
MLTDRHEQLLVDVYGKEYGGCAGWGWAAAVDAETAYRDLVQDIEAETGDTADHMDYDQLLARCREAI